MVTVIINGVEVLVDKNSTVLQACESIGIEIPRFCFHERFHLGRFQQRRQICTS